MCNVPVLFSEIILNDIVIIQMFDVDVVLDKTEVSTVAIA